MTDVVGELRKGLYETAYLNEIEAGLLRGLYNYVIAGNHDRIVKVWKEKGEMRGFPDKLHLLTDGFFVDVLCLRRGTFEGLAYDISYSLEELLGNHYGNFDWMRGDDE